MGSFDPCVALAMVSKRPNGKDPSCRWFLIHTECHVSSRAYL